MSTVDDTSSEEIEESAPEIEPDSDQSTIVPLHPDRKPTAGEDASGPSNILVAFLENLWVVLKQLLGRPGTPWLGLILASAMLTPCLLYGLSCDDYVIRWIAKGYPGIPELADQSRFDTFRFATGDVQRNLIYQDHGLMPWYANPEVRIAFARGLASLSHHLDFWLFGDWALPMYLQNLAWYAAACGALIFFYRRIIPVKWVACLAALLYMFDESHAMPVGWISNRNGLMALFFVVLTLYFHERWRTDGGRKFAAFAFGSFAIGMLCGEASVTACAYVFAYAVCLDNAGVLKGLIAIVPYAIICVIWAIPYKLMNYGTFGSGFYQDPVNETGEYLDMIIGRYPILLNSLFGRPFARLSFWVSQMEFAVIISIALVLLLFTAYVLMPMIWREKRARFFAIGMCLSLLPACATIAHDRNLLYASIGTMGLIAMFFGGMVSGAAWLRESPVWGRAAQVLVVFWIFIHVMVAPFSVPAEAAHMGEIGVSLNNTMVAIPEDPTRAERDWVMLNMPSDLDGWYLPGMFDAADVTMPAHMWHLTTGPFEADLTRTGPNSFTIHPEGGYLIAPWGRFFTSFDYTMVPGYSVELSGMKAEVLRVTPDGRPKEVEFTFDRPLEDPSLEFMAFHDFVYKPFEMPEIGETVEMPANWIWAPKSEWIAYKKASREQPKAPPHYKIRKEDD